MHYLLSEEAWAAQIGNASKGESFEYHGQSAGYGPNVGLCSAYDIKTRAEYEMWQYDLIYFGYLATGLLPDNPEIPPGSNDFTRDLAAMRSNPPETPNRFAASNAVSVPTEASTATPIPQPVKGGSND